MYFHRLNKRIYDFSILIHHLRNERAIIYVVPTIEKSFNNKLIKEKKAKLIDSIDEIK